MNFQTNKKEPRAVCERSVIMTQRQFIDFLKKIEPLKARTRHCWNPEGRQESVAEHSWRLALMPMLLRREFPQVNIDRVIQMCLIHDIGEAVTGDVPAFLKTAEDEETEAEAISGLLQSLPREVAVQFAQLFEEMRAMETEEAKLYKALDNMEAVISHNETDISTWLPNEYELQLTYGENNVQWSSWLQGLKEQVNQDTLSKIEQEKRGL